MSRKGRSRDVSSSPASSAQRQYIALSDDDEDLGTADLTLSILAAAEKRGRDRPDGAARPAVVVLASEDGARSEGEIGGQSANSGGLEPGEELEEGELNDAAEPEAELELQIPAMTTTTGRKRRKKKEKRRMETSASVVNMEDTKRELGESAEVKLQDAEESLAMRKLLRGPRYFDPPEEQGEMCYSCGQIGHRAADCTEQPRQKPCYVCGNFGHDGYDCLEKTECFECGKSGHVARNCPNKYTKTRSSTGLCLLCGRLGHDVSSCSGEYDPDDMKQVQCYICKRTGHLCCIEVVDACPIPVSCYQCGDQGHTGVGCTRQNGDRDKTSCYRCGQEGHFARDCHQMNRDYNIKQRRHSWPAPWPEDNGRYRDQESPVIPACHIRPTSFKSRLERASSGKYDRHDDSSRRGYKRKRNEDEDDRWTPRSTDSRRRRSRD